MQVAAHKNPQYSNADFSTKSNRTLEYDAIATVTAKLKRASSSDTSFQLLTSALDKNTRMWGVIAASVADPRNSYPPELKASLFYLYEFTAQQTQKVLSKTADISILVDINMSILKGLKGQEK